MLYILLNWARTIIDFICPHCTRVLKVPDQYIGQSGKCNHCGARVTIIVAPPPLPRSAASDVRPTNRSIDSSLSVIIHHFPALFTPLDESAINKIESKLGKLNAFQKINANTSLAFIDTLPAEMAAELEQYTLEIDASDRPAARKASMRATKRKRLLGDYRHRLVQAIGKSLTGKASEENAIKRGSAWKAWITAGDGQVCGDCARNEAAGWIPINMPFPTGDAATPCNCRLCRCTVSYRTAPPNERSTEHESEPCRPLPPIFTPGRHPPIKTLNLRCIRVDPK